MLFAATGLDPAAQKPFVDNLNVVVTASTKSLEDLVAEGKAKYPSVLTNYKVITDQSIDMPNGQPAHLLGGTFDAEGYGPEENIQLIIVNGGKSYTVTFTSPAVSFDKYHDLVQASLASFVLG